MNSALEFLKSPETGNVAKQVSSESKPSQFSCKQYLSNMIKNNKVLGCFSTALFIADLENVPDFILSQKYLQDIA